MGRRRRRIKRKRRRRIRRCTFLSSFWYGK
jgi:hypothetical protein